MTDRTARTHPGEGSLLLVPSPATPPSDGVVGRPAPPRFPACSERLPRDLLVRLAALSREVADLSREHTASVELCLRLDDVVIDLDAMIRSIHDETVQHLAARRV